MAVAHRTRLADYMPIGLVAGFAQAEDRVSEKTRAKPSVGLTMSTTELGWAHPSAARRTHAQESNDDQPGRVGRDARKRTLRTHGAQSMSSPDGLERLGAREHGERKST